jgi:hypothetical protein
MAGKELEGEHYDMVGEDTKLKRLLQQFLLSR